MVYFYIITISSVVKSSKSRVEGVLRKAGKRKAEMRCGSALFSFLALIIFSWCCISAFAKDEKERKKMEPTRLYQSGESKVLVFDNVLGEKMLSATNQYVTAYATWFFVHQDPHEGFQRRDNGDLDWVAPFSPKSFSESRLWNTLKKKLLGTGVFDGRILYPFDVEGVMLLRGLSPTVYKGQAEGDLFIRIFLTRKVKKNDYSELLIYNKDEEIFASVFPKYGRVAVWNDTADFMFRPPSVNVEQAEYSLFIKATENRQKFDKHEEEYQKTKVDYKYQLNREFPLVNETYEDIYKINLGDHLTKNFTDNTGRIVAVFDGVVPKEELDLLRSYFMKSNSAYLYDGYDGDFTESNDNVNWIVKKFPLSILKSRIWKYVHHCASYLSGERQWFPYDIAMNILQHSHQPRIHADCNLQEHEYTFLMYLNPNWSEEKYGETIFVEEVTNRKRDSDVTGNEKYETLSAVVPKYGRIVIFRNIIDHSARPPSPNFLSARYTFAVKVGRSPVIAMAKALRELLDAVPKTSSVLKLEEDINEGKYNVFNDPEKERLLQKKLTAFNDLSIKIRNDEKMQLLDLLQINDYLP